ncbi:MAG: zinc ABC transporter substrate-binding protein [Dehalococcoidia bacterium]|nr:zinc ABC transporter substrate-binding protein [Dehalococcoidia bacterium]
MRKYCVVLLSAVSILAAALVFLNISCQGTSQGVEKIGVVVTIVPQIGFVQNVGGDKVDITVMVPPGADPHTYEPTPSQMVKISEAKMYAKVGSGVEFELTWMGKIIEQNKAMLVVDCSNGIQMREMEGYNFDEDSGEYHRGEDPHIWLSPKNAKLMVENICTGLIQVDPQSEAYYNQNRDEYLAKLDALDKYIQEELSGIGNRRFIVFHPSWGYFAKDYNLEQIPIEIGGKEPSAKDIANLIQKAEEQNIKVIFASPEFNPRSAEVIAKEIGGRVIFIDPLAEDYIGNMRTVLKELVQAMQ